MLWRDALVLLAHDVLEHGSHIGHHLGVVDGLKHIAKRAQLNGGARGLEVLVTADNHDTAARIAPADLLAELNAVHERHVQIGDEQIGLRSPLPEHGKRRAPVVRRHDLDLRQVLMKQKRQPLHHESLVISDQNPHSALPFRLQARPFPQDSAAWQPRRLRAGSQSPGFPDRHRGRPAAGGCFSRP